METLDRLSRPSNPFNAIFGFLFSSRQIRKHNKNVVSLQMNSQFEFPVRQQRGRLVESGGGDEVCEAGWHGCLSAQEGLLGRTGTRFSLQRGAER